MVIYQLINAIIKTIELGKLKKNEMLPSIND